MVKVNDPRADRSGIAMRSLRAISANKCIKSIVKKSKVIDTSKVKDRLDKLDNDFSEEFNNCSDTIKQELIFLWEEVGDLNKLLEESESRNNGEVNGEVNEEEQVNKEEMVDDVVEVKLPQKIKLFGP